MLCGYFIEHIAFYLLLSFSIFPSFFHHILLGIWVCVVDLRVRRVLRGGDFGKRLLLDWNKSLVRSTDLPRSLAGRASVRNRSDAVSNDGRCGDTSDVIADGTH